MTPDVLLSRRIYVATLQAVIVDCHAGVEHTYPSLHRALLPHISNAFGRYPSDTYLGEEYTQKR